MHRYTLSYMYVFNRVTVVASYVRIYDIISYTISICIAVADLNL